MTTKLTSDQLMDIYTKQVRLHRFLIDHPELYQFQTDLENSLTGLTPIQKCIALTTKMRENQLQIANSFSDIQELANELINTIESLKLEDTHGRGENTN